MKHLEEELRKALQRKEAPSGFADRLSRRIEAGELTSESRWRRQRTGWSLPRMGWLGAAAMICLMIGLGILQYRSYRTRMTEGAYARDQLLLALQIAGDKVSLAQRRVLEIQRRQEPSARQRDEKVREGRP